MRWNRLPDLVALRFDGDFNDAATLLGQYGAAAAVAALEREQRLHGKRPWDECPVAAIPLSPALTPRLYAMVSDACARLGVVCSIRLFSMAVTQIDAYAFLDRDVDQAVLSFCLTCPALEHLSDPELLFMIGHELGHVIYEHDRLNRLCDTGGKRLEATVLPAMGEWIFLRWRQKAEISADRVGWLLSGRFEDGAGAIIKSATGLTGKNLSLTAESIRSFLEEDTPPPGVSGRKHPYSPLLQGRLRALRVVEDSAPAKAHGVKKRPGWIQESDKAVAGILDSLSRYPDSAVGLACMNLIADAGVEMVQRDLDVATDEIKKVLHILHDHFTDQPDKVICLEPIKRASRLKSAIRVLKRTATSTEKQEVLSRLADVAFADGPFREEEAKVILDLATSLKIPQHEAYSIIVGCIQTTGREVDAGIQALADKLASASTET